MTNRLRLVNGKWEFDVDIPNKVDKPSRYIGVTGLEYEVFDSFIEADDYVKVYQLTYYEHTSRDGTKEILPVSTQVK